MEAAAAVGARITRSDITDRGAMMVLRNVGVRVVGANRARYTLVLPACIRLSRAVPRDNVGPVLVKALPTRLTSPGLAQM